MSAGAYREYLQLDALLGLQQPRSSQRNSELAFIIVHQAYELWFKLIIADLQRVVVALDEDETQVSLASLHRVGMVEELLLAQLSLLEAMDPCDFAVVREHFGSASGAESAQFALIEALSSSAIPTRRSGRHRDVWQAFCDMLDRNGFPMPTDGDDSARHKRLETLRHVYASQPPHRGGVRDLCDALWRHDWSFALWRYRHALTAFRHIGEGPGTAGTAGVRYLERRLRHRFYPELWEISSEPADRPRSTCPHA